MTLRLVTVHLDKISLNRSTRLPGGSGVSDTNSETTASSFYSGPEEVFCGSQRTWTWRLGPRFNLPVKLSIAEEQEQMKGWKKQVSPPAVCGC